MVLKIFNGNEEIPYSHIDSTFCCTKSYGGMMSLQFDISPNNKFYKYFLPETELEYEEQRYLVKGINERKSVSTITCQINLDGLSKNVYTSYNKTTESFYNICREILTGTGWSVVGSELVSSRRSLELQDVTTLDILNYCCNSTAYNISYRFDSKNKVIYVIKPGNNTEPTGTYFTDELNLTELNYKGSSTSFVTRLYPYGKDGLTIADVNNGKEYIDNNSYSDKIVSQIWRDERYTDAQSLYDDSVVKLAALAVPEQSYTCKVVDLAKALPNKYGAILNYDLYDVITLIDRKRKTRVNHRIVEVKEYPAKPTLNTVTLSSVAATVSGKLTTINDRLTKLDAQQLYERKKVNEIKQDLDTTVLHISESWAESENESLFTQTSEGIYLEVDKIVGTNRWSTLLRQSATDVMIAWNNISQNIKFENNGENAQINIYEESNSKLMSLDRTGQKFYYNNTLVGKTGTNCYVDNTDLRGLVFDLENSAAYMAWAHRTSENDDGYTLKFIYTAKKIGDYDADQLHAACDLNLHNNYLRNTKLSSWYFDGGCISDSISFAAATDFNSDGTAVAWKKVTLNFKNGILQSGTFGNS